MTELRLRRHDSSLLFVVWSLSALACNAKPERHTSASAASGKHAGSYRAQVTNPGGLGSYSADVTIGTTGAYYSLTWTIGKERKYQGLGIEWPGFLAAGWGIREYRVYVYEISANRLIGRWAGAQSAGKLSRETLEGPPTLNGNYRIVDGHDSVRDVRYEGTLSIAPNGTIYRITRNVPGEPALGGVGIKKSNRLIVGAGPGGGAGVTVYTAVAQGLSGQWAQPGSNLLGTEYLTRR